MNILMVHPHDLFSPKEPWTTRIRNIAYEFKKKAHKVKLVYFPLEWKGHESRFTLEGVEFIPLSRRVGISAYIGNIFFLCQECKWADIVHFQKCFYHAALPAIFAAFVNNKPVHYDWDDWEIKIFNSSCRQPWFIGAFLALMERYVLVLCDTVSVSSGRLKEECLSYGINPDNLVMAPVGADLRLFNPAVSGIRVREIYNVFCPLVIYLGQLHSGQYAEQFIRAAKIILNQGLEVKFMIVGDGYRLEGLKKMARGLDLKEDIIFTGAVAHRDTPLYLAAADAAVACFEDNDITRCKSPLKIAEYLACGKPIIASDVGEVKRMLAGAGIVTIPGDPQDLACGIRKMLEDEPLRKRLSYKARQRAVEIYNWENTAKNILEAYDISF